MECWVIIGTDMSCDRALMLLLGIKHQAAYGFNLAVVKPVSLTLLFF